MILTQKLKLKEDDVKDNEEKLLNQIKALKFQLEGSSEEMQDLKKKLNESKNLNSDLKEKVRELQQEIEQGSGHDKKNKELVRQLEFQVDELMEQLETSDKARKQAK